MIEDAHADHVRLQLEVDPQRTRGAVVGVQDDVVAGLADGGSHVVETLTAQAELLRGSGERGANQRDALGAAVELDVALEAFAQGDSATAIAWLHQLDHRLASSPDHGPEAAAVLRARSRILVMSEALSEHASYFDAGAFA